MIHGFEGPRCGEDQELAALTTNVRVRVLNCAVSGCLLESSRPLTVGSVATLRIAFSMGEFEDTVRVVRCQAITGAGAVYHIGAEFLTALPPVAGSLRYLFSREIGDLTAWVMSRE
jgi:hypothetical protein